MSIVSDSRKRDIATLKKKDIVSLLLLGVYQLDRIPEYSTLSQLAYVLDKDSLMKLCATYGGCTIKIPTIHQLKVMVNVLLLYQYVNADGLSFKEAFELIDTVGLDRKEIMRTYKIISGAIENAQQSK